MGVLSTDPPWFFCGEPRWQRCNFYSLPSPVGHWSSCSPHRDAAGCSKHYVPRLYNPGWPNYDNKSGFDAARDWLWIELVQQDGMTFLGYTFFDNRIGLSQCNDEITSTDGKVNLIQLE